MYYIFRCFCHELKVFIKYLLKKINPLFSLFFPPKSF